MKRDDHLKNYVGVPYLSNGRNPAIGLDCWGLVRHASLVLGSGSTVPDYTGYLDSTDTSQTAALFQERHKWQSIPKGEEREGDVLLLRLAGHPVHAGIVVAPHSMLHTLQGRNSCLERYDGLSPWFRRWEGVYRWQII